MLIPNKHNGYSADGRRLYPMDFGGGGGGQQTSGGTAVQELPEWARPYAKSALEKGAALSEKPYQAYDAPRIAGFSPMQLQAQQAAAGMAPSAATGAGINVAAEAAMRGLGTQYQPGQFQNQFQAPEAYQAGRFGARPVRAMGLEQYQMGPAQQVSAPELQQYQMGPAERVRTQSFTRPGAAESFMSPYMQNVVDVQQREARRASDISGQQQQAEAVGRGAFGGSRDALMRAERERNLSRQLGDIQATGSQAAYNAAQQQFNAEQNARLQAQQANQQAGLTTGLQNLNALLGVQQLGAGQNLQAQLANQQAGLTTGQQNLAALLGVQSLGAQQGLQAQQLNQQAALEAQRLGEQSRQFGAGQGLQAASLGAQYGQAAQQLGEQSRQYGAGLGIQGLNTALQGAGQLGSLGGQQFGQAMDINKLQSAYGGQQQALRQQGLSQAYEDFQNQQNYPYKQLGFFSDLIRGLPVGQQTTRTMYEPAPSMAQQIGSIGLGAYGLSKFMADGGMAYADGGSVESPENVERIVSKLSDPQLQQAMQAAKVRGDVDQLEAIQNELAMRASERRGVAAGITPQIADRMAGGGVVAFAEGGASSYLDKLSKLGETDISETPEQREAGISAAMPGVEKRYGPSITAPYMEEVKKERAGLAKMSDEGVGLGALAASQALLRPGSASRAVAGAMGAFGQEVVKMKKEQREADRLLRQSEITLATAEQARKDGLIGKAESLYDKSQAQKEKGLDRQIGVAEKQATIQAGIENSKRQAAASMASVNKPTDLDKQAQAIYEAKVAKDPSIATNPVKKAEAMSESRATAADQLGRYPGSVRADAAAAAAEAKTTTAANAALDKALEGNRPYIVAMQKGDYEEAARIRAQVAGVLASQKPKGEGAPALAAAQGVSVTAGGKTYTFPDQASADKFKAAAGIK